MGLTVSDRKLKYLEFIHREESKRHHTYTEDMYPYDLLKAGDMKAVEVGHKMFSSNLTGHISDDPLRNYKYLFVAATTLACRAAISGGMESERAFNISDLFILKMDTLNTVDDIISLHSEMLEFYTKEMAGLDKGKVYSKPVIQSIDYIYNHLHENIGLSSLSDHTGLNGSYLSTLFKRETGKTVTDYILSKRMEAAENMLKFSDYSCSEIGAILAFSSQSHFTRVFKSHTGKTPAEYRRENYSG